MIAAVFCLFAASVFALAGGFDYFRSIFGDTAKHVEQDIQSPGITAADSDRQMTLESMLTDGYKINLIVSLKALSGEAKANTFDHEPIDLFDTNLTPNSSYEHEVALSYTCSELEEFSTENRHFYHLQLDSLENNRTGSYKELASISDRLTKPVQPSLVQLPPMRILSSCLKENSQISDVEGFSRWVQMHGIPSGRSGAHERFDTRTEAGDIILLKLAKDFQNSSPYLDYYWEGGLFAAADLYLDEDMNAGFCSLLSAFDNNPYYEIDYTHGGRLRQEPLLEDLISPDSRRELVSLLVPVKKRLPDPNCSKPRRKYRRIPLRLRKSNGPIPCFGRRMSPWIS